MSTAKQTIRANASPKTDGGVVAADRMDAVGDKTPWRPRWQPPGSCADCRHFWRDQALEDGYGECHCLPPQCVAIEPGVHDVAWPTVREDECCGQWRELPEGSR